MTVALDGGAPLQLTYGPGNRVAIDVLRDGRILFEADHDLYTVYSDGSGVESYRCDHGPDRRGGQGSSPPAISCSKRSAAWPASLRRAPCNSRCRCRRASTPEGWPNSRRSPG